jgi:hypothetical protein
MYQNDIQINEGSFALFNTKQNLNKNAKMDFGSEIHITPTPTPLSTHSHTSPH